MSYSQSVSSSFENLSDFDINKLSNQELINIINDLEETLNNNAIKESSRIIKHDNEVQDLKQKLAIVITELKQHKKKIKKTTITAKFPNFVVDSLEGEQTPKSRQMFSNQYWYSSLKHQNTLTPKTVYTHPKISSQKEARDDSCNTKSAAYCRLYF